MLQYYSTISGKGNKVAIFLPGTGWSGSMGMPIADALQKEFTTHMIDLPGIGKSTGIEGVVTERDMADWLQGYIEKNHLDKVAIIGHSLGGIIGLAYAFYYPKKVDRLILLDIGYDRVNRFPVKMFGKTGYFLPIISICHKLFGQGLLGKELNDEQVSKPKTEEEIKKVIEKFKFEDSPFIREAIENQRSSNLSGISLLLAAYRSNPPKILKTIQMPCLLLYGNREKSPAAAQRKVKKEVEGINSNQVKVQMLKGDHYAHVQDKRALEYISTFLT
ncbi:alpha/beta fold hydrolase [Viridibacillus arvi]|uniref:alpha/beta fold hydrolase n=1 Tax=Viridibacillus arvi TaxID=263475 RepID=UPI00187BB70D|nr:alpha/beta hydrolase [Viridibacillus sp. JNUCC-6]QOV12172.1 alpha/beta hydrolase [Viridibacillus sp. JNUCC-6]